ncbi:nucleotidyltransferase family protein [Kineosporia sp. R_H_3]|uniref:nucleotidyltransferase family protein n=1 Tax=Kineosporia sp. R_H_3 TaxID=1961848 RepID=UPI0013044350|nr:nucleotidyltransferase family protein [Kineosporia sp. R_H_3]
MARQLRLDQVALRAIGALSDAAVPHALIKGVTTATWLYDPPRDYRDVDLLVPASRLGEAVNALVSNGVVVPVHGAPGEEAPHSLVLTTPRGAEVDLHVGLPALPPVGRSDRLWEVLASHISSFEVGGRLVPALDVPARCVVLALHAVASGHLSAQVREDFRRAREVVTPGEWGSALALASELGVTDYVTGAILVTDGVTAGGLEASVSLQIEGASPSAIQLERVLRLSPPAAFRMVAAELFPSRLMISRMFPDGAGRRASYLRGSLRRLRFLAARLPGAVREVRRARSSARSGDRRPGSVSGNGPNDPFASAGH